MAWKGVSQSFIVFGICASLPPLPSQRPESISCLQSYHISASCPPDWKEPHVPFSDSLCSVIPLCLGKDFLPSLIVPPLYLQQVLLKWPFPLRQAQMPLIKNPWFCSSVCLRSDQWQAQGVCFHACCLHAWLSSLSVFRTLLLGFFLSPHRGSSVSSVLLFTPYLIFFLYNIGPFGSLFSWKIIFCFNDNIILSHFLSLWLLSNLANSSFCSCSVNISFPRVTLILREVSSPGRVPSLSSWYDSSQLYRQSRSPLNPVLFYTAMY